MFKLNENTQENTRKNIKIHQYVPFTMFTIFESNFKMHCISKNKLFVYFLLKAF